mmetsp:Transcript_39150/g.75028  ORF Transcript_39150/g.75028 Transcript_39150/m.75028 type:complete len:272 (-) Transcript_39150:235-1050(-)
MMYIMVVGGAVVASAVVFLWIFRRRAPRLTDLQLHKYPGVPDDVHVVSKVPNDARDAIKSAFLAGSDFRWMTIGGDGNLPELDEEGSQLGAMHKRLTRYMIECVMCVAERYGHVLTCVDEEGSTIGALCIIPPYPSQWLFNLHFMRTVIPLGVPEPRSMGNEVNARFEAFLAGTESGHKSVMGESPHWYVVNLGVAPRSQGKKVGMKLIKTAIALAGDLPIYLECHDGNVAFYQKAGFEVARHLTLTPKARGSPGDTTFPYNVMTKGHIKK